jgi:CRP/FNR family transcriptional regulator
MINFSRLNQIPLLSSLNDETLHLISELAFTQSRAAGCNLVVEGMPAEFCYFILSGYVRALRISRDGRVQVLSRFGPGSPINLISLLKAERVNQASLETLTPVKLLTLDQPGFDKLLKSCPDFSAMLLRIFAERMSQVIDLAADLSLHSVRTRLARFLIEIADQPSQISGWTQDEIAAHIGTVRDVVGRLLREFENEGLISRNRQNITLLNRNGLLREAEQELP